ncbi:hypothetical protein CsSME_00031233 [Camellia sinensis var. sinensis]
MYVNSCIIPPIFIFNCITHGIHLLSNITMVLYGYSNADWWKLHLLEFKEATHSSKRSLGWLSYLIHDIDLWHIPPPILFLFHARTKHIEIDSHFVREKAVAGDLITQFVSLENQVVDIFTKALSHHPFQKLGVKLGLCIAGKIPVTPIGKKKQGLKGKIQGIIF